MNDKKRVSLYLDQDLYEQIEQEASRYGLKISTYIRSELIKKYRQSKED